MAIDTPDGYLTRPSAAKVYNRSKRALERDLELAIAMVDEEVLGAFQLLTNDGTIRPAREVTTELVETLKSDGMNPVWCVREAWLEARYGLKGESRPEREEGSVRQVVPRVEEEGRVETSASSRVVPPADVRPEGSLGHEIEFLRERIRTLEREKREEIERNEKREVKLFEQLAVKDRQISAWDEVTQGLTRGLATGQIAPALAVGSNGPRQESREAPTVDVEVVEGEKKRRTTRPNKASRPTKTKIAAKKKVKPTSVGKKRKTKAKREGKKPERRSWLGGPITKLFSRRAK